MSYKQSLKISISFKENIRDLKIYNYIQEEIKQEEGISTYLKRLVKEDMEKKNKWQ